MTHPSHRPSPWLLAPAAAALTLFGFAHQDAVFPSLCFLCVVGAYCHPWSLPKRHPWLMSMATCAALFCLSVLYHWLRTPHGEAVADFDRLGHQPWLMGTAPLFQAAILPWAWHMPRRSTGLIFACVGIIAITSSAILPPSYAIANLYALLGGSCLLSLFALGGAFNSGRDQPFRERCRQSLVVLACIAIIGVGTWYTSAGLQHIATAVDTRLANFLPGSHDWGDIGTGDAIHIARQRRVRLSRRVVATLSGSRSPGYLRTQVMTRYHRQIWTAASTPLPPSLDRYRHTGHAREGQGAEHREGRLHVDLQGAVPLPYGAARVHVPQPLSCLQTDGAIMQCSPSSQLTSYAFELVAPHVPVPFGIGFALPAPDTGASLSTMAQSLRQALDAPEAVLSQLRPLAHRIVATDAAHALVAAQKIQQHFRENFTYSLDVNLSSQGDPIVDFVRHRRPAYCEYFASGMALMLRALGIPARVVGGFRVWEYNALLQQWVVRQRDAHAWVEVYDDLRQRWVGFDATPALQQERFSRPRLLGFLDQSRTWAEWHVRAIVDKLYKIDFMAPLMRPFKTWSGSIAARGLILAVFIAAVYWLWRQMRRSMPHWWRRLQWPWPVRRRPAHALHAMQAEAQQLFTRLAIFLQQRGAPILPTETLEEYVERCQRGDAYPPTYIDLLADFTRAYDQLRFHPWPAASEAQWTCLQERLSTLRHTAEQLQSHCDINPPPPQGRIIRHRRKARRVIGSLTGRQAGDERVDMRSPKNG